MSVILGVIYIVLFIGTAIAVFYTGIIYTSGLTWKDVFEYIDASSKLYELEIKAKKSDKMSWNQQLLFMQDAEKMFKAYDKMPDVIKSNEYAEYKDIVDAYQRIRCLRWQEQN